MKKYVLLLFIFLSLISPRTPAAAKPVVIASIQEWTQFNPVNVNVAATQALLHFVTREIVKRNIAGVVIADLAADIPTVKNKQVTFITEKGVRKTVVDWRLRASAKWGDGQAVTCADWQTGWQVGLSANVSVSDRSTYSKIEKIQWDKKTPQHCKVTYSTDSWNFDRDLPAVLPKHLEAAVFDKWKDKSEAYDQNSIYVKEPTNPGLYNGPYLVSEFKLGSHVILKANPYFYGGKPGIESFIVKLTSDTSSLRAQLSTGAVDIISANGFPADSALALDQESLKPESAFRVHFQASPNFQGLFFNMESEPLKDPAVRKAISVAINKKELTEAFFQGKIEPAESVFPTQSPAHRKEVPSFDPKRANKVLEAAGWKLNGKKIYEKNGKELSIEFITSSGIKVLETVQTFICSNLAKVGIQCLVKNQPPRVFLGSSVPHGEFAVAMFGQPVVPDSSMTGIFSSREIPTDKNGWAGGNVTRWKSAKADELLLQFDRQWDANKRTRLMQAIEKEILQDRPLIPLYHRREAFVLPKKLQGFSEDVSGIDFAFPEKWRLE